jgi:hypothetical protein
MTIHYNSNGEAASTSASPKGYFKATAPTGRDFRTGTIDYAGALVTGELVKHPLSGAMLHNEASTYLSVSVVPAETLIGGAYPCRLFVVEPVGEILDNLSASRYKRACKSLRVIEELPGWQALGPNGQRVDALIKRARALEYAEARKLDAAWDAARDAAWGAAWGAARGAARGAAWDAALGAAWDAARGAAWDAAWGAALAELSRDLITEAQYNLLAGPWNSVIDPAGAVGP